MGNANLHNAWYSFNNGEKLEYKAGIREFTYSDTMKDLKMYVNGHRFFPKGGNWGFSEINLRYGAREYDKAIHLAKQICIASTKARAEFLLHSLIRFCSHFVRAVSRC